MSRAVSAPLRHPDTEIRSTSGNAASLAQYLGVEAHLITALRKRADDAQAREAALERPSGLSTHPEETMTFRQPALPTLDLLLDPEDRVAQLDVESQCRASKRFQ